ncbi:hypothetical protein HWV62_38476 [Athelia sp. TMB]|nr:hypothetical protein HWV62_38476 [Athelia sp. TMB]
MASSSPSPPSSNSLTSSPINRYLERQVDTPAVSRLKGLLRENLRITTSDGRIFVGTFAGTDQPLNVILINTEEFRLGPGENRNGRYVGQIVTPWKCIVKIEAAGRQDPESEDLYT